MLFGDHDKHVPIGTYVPLLLPTTYAFRCRYLSGVVKESNILDSTCFYQTDTTRVRVVSVEFFFAMSLGTEYFTSLTGYF